MEKLSAIVITKNEIINIDGLIDNLEFADEIIVVDSFSTDGTYEKLKTIDDVKVFQKEFKNFPDQKNYAMGLASHDWVLFIDADERVTPDLNEEIKSILNQEGSDIVAYNAHFQYYFGKTPVNYSGFQSAKSFRLFRNSCCEYDMARPVHENLIVIGRTGLLKNRIAHFSFRDFDHYKEKMRLYAHLKARQLHKKGQRSNFFKAYIKPLYRFINHYIMRLGILDGKVGYDISILNAYEVKERYRELKRLNSLNSKVV
ncbi:MAG: glycosyltransferase family 2 protein [Flavobacteriaceae bacterium]|nr:glycosyltransferase family 2 protein [Flavobacteriaceae bacterium]